MLSDREKAELTKLTPTLLEAIRKVMLYPIYYEGAIRKNLPTEPEKNFILERVRDRMDNEQIGQELKASVIALGLLEKGFRKLERYNIKNKQENKGRNPAR